jgi:hypothetical protein
MTSARKSITVKDPHEVISGDPHEDNTAAEPPPPPVAVTGTHNLDRSQRRADAVVRALSSE